MTVSRKRLLGDYHGVINFSKYVIWVHYVGVANSGREVKTILSLGTTLHQRDVTEEIYSLSIGWILTLSKTSVVIMT
jgi:hypothetical protein